MWSVIRIWNLFEHDPQANMCWLQKARLFALLCWNSMYLIAIKKVWNSSIFFFSLYLFFFTCYNNNFTAPRYNSFSHFFFFFSSLPRINIEISVCVMFVQRFVTFGRKQAHGSIKAYRIMIPIRAIINKMAQIITAIAVWCVIKLR